MCLHRIKGKRYIKKNIYSDVNFYEKENELYEIYFPVWLGEFKGGKCPCENLNISNFNANKNITTKHIIKSFSKSLPSYNNI